MRYLASPIELARQNGDLNWRLGASIPAWAAAKRKRKGMKRSPEPQA